jgi:GDP-L-fucose synthase
VRDLLEMIRTMVGATGVVRWDHAKPDGQPRRSLDTSRAAREFGWRARTSLRTGLKQTIEWFNASRAATAF